MSAATVVQSAPLTSLDAIATGSGNPSISQTGVEIMLEPVPDIELKSVAPKAVPKIIDVFCQSISKILFLPQSEFFNYCISFEITHDQCDVVDFLSQWKRARVQLVLIETFIFEPGDSYMRLEFDKLLTRIF